MRLTISSTVDDPSGRTVYKHRVIGDSRELLIMLRHAIVYAYVETEDPTQDEIALLNKWKRLETPHSREEVCCLLREKSKSWTDCNEAMIDFLDGNKKFYWTEQGGWIDLKHVLNAAKYSDTIGDDSAELWGWDHERVTIWSEPVSAFSAEDLPSNHYGTELRAYLKALNDESPCNLAINIVTFSRHMLGGFGEAPVDRLSVTSDSPRSLNYIYNFSKEPVLDPDGKDILTDEWTGIRYKSGNTNIDWRLLESLRGAGHRGDVFRGDVPKKTPPPGGGSGGS